MSRRPAPRTGDQVPRILLVDKPAGPTSFQVIGGLRRRFSAGRAGHGGTLDSAASGLLVVGIGPATRLLSFALGHDKEYRAEVLFGCESDTLDLSGRILRDEPAAPDPQAVREALETFLGETEQEPPLYSALKLDGRRLSRRVRDGESPDLSGKRRRVRIDSIDDIHYEQGRQARVAFTVRCRAGTYIRSLARDLGRALQLPALLCSLRRLAVGGLRVNEAVAPDHPLETFPFLTPADFLRRLGLPGFVLTALLSQAVAHGNPVPLDGPPLEECFVHDATDRLLATGSRDGAGRFHPRRVFGV